MRSYKGLRQGESVSAKAYTALERALAGAHGTGGARVSLVNGCLQVHAAGVATHPYQVSDVSIPGDGWHIAIVQGYFSTANQSTQGTQWGPVCADVEIYDPVMYLYLHAEFDADELLTGTPELVLLEDTDPVLTADTFADGYLQLAKIEQAGTLPDPSIVITQYVDTNVLHRKINLTHLWSYGEV